MLGYQCIVLPNALADLALIGQLASLAKPPINSADLLSYFMHVLNSESFNCVIHFNLTVLVCDIANYIPGMVCHSDNAGMT
jgi:hypothetical protein